MHRLQTLKVPTEAEIKAVIGKDYDQTYETCKIWGNSERVVIELGRMYQFVALNLGHVGALAQLVGTDLDHVRTDKDAQEGCETCDYGSSYTMTYTFEAR